MILNLIRQELQVTPRKLELSDDVISEASRLLASHKKIPIKTLDVIHIASCLCYGTRGFVTNDKQQAHFATKVGLIVEYLS